MRCVCIVFCSLLRWLCWVSSGVDVGVYFKFSVMVCCVCGNCSGLFCVVICVVMVVVSVVICCCVCVLWLLVSVVMVWVIFVCYLVFSVGLVVSFCSVWCVCGMFWLVVDVIVEVFVVVFWVVVVIWVVCCLSCVDLGNIVNVCFSLLLVCVVLCVVSVLLMVMLYLSFSLVFFSRLLVGLIVWMVVRIDIVLFGWLVKIVFVLMCCVRCVLSWLSRLLCFCLIVLCLRLSLGEYSLSWLCSWNMCCVLV